MREKKLVKLNIDKEFKDLVRPLLPSEYKQLMENLQLYGCREPIVVWNGVIIDGHNRYEICMRLKIPFATIEQPFESRDDAISWICANQLGRRNISEETRKYLIGKRYEAEKAISMNRNPNGWNQYLAGAQIDGDGEAVVEEIEQHPVTPEELARATRQTTAERIGDEYHISHGTVEKYGYYSRALDIIAEKEPALFPRILSGRYKVSHRNVIGMSQLDKQELKQLNRRMSHEKKQKPFVPYAVSRQQLNESERSEAEVRSDIQIKPEIKNMPEYDPDAEITGLTLTIPTWANSIERTLNRADMTVVTPKARQSLEDALAGLQNAIHEILKVIKE